jgi:hypothetical protein
MKKNIIIAIIVVLILIVAVFIFEKIAVIPAVPIKENNILKTSTTTPENKISTSSVNNTSATTTLENARSTSTSVALGWVTYTNEKFGFSIDYPKNFVYQETGSDINPDFGVYFGGEKMAGPADAIMTVGVTSAPKTFDEYFLFLKDTYQIDEKTTIGGDEAFYYSTISKKSDRGLVIYHNHKFYTIFTISFNDDFRNIPDDFSPGEANYFLSEGDYNRVKSSFKFLK